MGGGGLGGWGGGVKLYFIDRPQEMEESGAVMHMHVTTPSPFFKGR